MAIINKLSGAFPTALIYITLGTLIDIWTIVWFVFNAPETRSGYFWVVGFFMTGLALFIIGLFLGRIGRSARSAELPPSEVTAAAVQSEQNAAARTPVVLPASPAVQGRVVKTPVPGGFSLAGPTVLQSE